MVAVALTAMAPHATNEVLAHLGRLSRRLAWAARARAMLEPVVALGPWFPTAGRVALLGAGYGLTAWAMLAARPTLRLTVADPAPDCEHALAALSRLDRRLIVMPWPEGPLRARGYGEPPIGTAPTGGAARKEQEKLADPADPARTSICAGTAWDHLWLAAATAAAVHALTPSVWGPPLASLPTGGTITAWVARWQRPGALVFPGIASRALGMPPAPVAETWLNEIATACACAGIAAAYREFTHGPAAISLLHGVRA